MTRATMTLIVCLVASVWPEGAQAQSAWRVAARLLVRTGGGHLEERKGFLVSDPVAGRVGFERQLPDGFDARYDRITGLHYEDGAKHPGRVFNKDVEFYLTIHHSDDAGRQLVSTVRLNEDDVASTLHRLEADTGLTVDRTEARRSFLGLPIRVAVGDSVSIVDITGKQTKGRVAALSEASLAVVGPGGVARVFEQANVAKIRLRYKPRQAALLGFVSGAAAGGAVVALGCGAYGGCEAGDLPYVVLMAAGAGVWGASFSVALGAIVHPLSKSPEVYLGGRGAGGAAAAVTVGPLLTRQRRGIAVSVTF